jgi:hypothetical protein
MPLSKNISVFVVVISLVEETAVPGENHRSVANLKYTICHHYIQPVLGNIIKLWAVVVVIVWYLVLQLPVQ